MQKINSNYLPLLHDVEQLTDDLWEKIQAELAADKTSEILILIAGGSLIGSVIPLLRKLLGLPVNNLQRITLAPLDERWVAIGSDQSNWEQLLSKFKHETDIDLKNTSIKLHPVLGSSLHLNGAVEQYDHLIKRFLASGKVITLFGLGIDGHLAGIMRHHEANQETFHKGDVIGYPVDEKHVDLENMHLDKSIPARVSPDLELCRLLSMNSVFSAVIATGASKLAVLRDLLDHEHLPVYKFPAMVLKPALNAQKLLIYTDRYNIKSLGNS